MCTFSPDSLFTYWSDSHGKEQPEAYSKTITFNVFIGVMLMTHLFTYVCVSFRGSE